MPTVDGLLEYLHRLGVDVVRHHGWFEAAGAAVERRAGCVGGPMAQRGGLASRAIAPFAWLVVGIVVTAGWCGVSGAAFVAARSSPVVARAQAFPGPDDAYLITVVGRLTAADYGAQLHSLQKILTALRQQKQQLGAEIVAKQKSLEACCALRKHVARCSTLRTDLEAFRLRHRAWLSAMDRRFAERGSVSPTQLQSLADGVAPGGRTAMALAMTIAMEIAQLDAACAQP